MAEIKINLNIDAASAQAALKNVSASIQGIETGLKNAGEAGARAFNFNQLAEGIQRVTGAFQGVVDVGVKYDDTLKAVGAVTGVTGAGLDDLGNRGRELAKQFGGSAADQLSSFQGILSKFGAEVAQQPEALAKMAENVNLLAKAGGINAQQAMGALTDTMLQFGLVTGDSNKDAEASTKIIDALASSAQIGAAEIPDVAQSILQVGVAAKGANLSVEQTVGALQVLAVGGKKGSEAGVALRNVLSLLQKASGESEKTLSKLGTSSAELGKILTTQGLEGAVRKLKGGLDNLGSAAERNTALFTVFGAENAAAAGILLDNVDKIGTFTNGIQTAVQQGVNATNGAVAQANINMQSSGAVLSRIKAQVEDTFIGITQAVGSNVTAAIGAVNQLAPTLTGIAGLKTLIPEGAFTQITEKAKEAGSKSAEFLKTAFEKVPLDGLKTRIGDAFTKLNINPAQFSAQFGKLGETAAKSLSGGLSSLSAAAFNPLTLGIAAAAGALALFFTQTEAGKKTFEEIKKIGSEAFANLSKAFAPLAKVFGELFTSIASQSGGLLTALSPLLNLFGQGLALAAQGLGKVLVTVFTGAAAVINTLASGITGAIAGVQAFFGAISPLTTAIGKLSVDVANFVKAFAVGTFNNIVAIFSALGGAIATVASTIGKFIGEQLQPLFKVFADIGSAISGFIASLFGTSDATKQAATNTAAIGTAAQGAANGVSLFQRAIKFLTDSITNVRAALAGISAVLSTVGAAFAQFLEGVKTLDLGKITSAFSDLGGKVQASFTQKWNETWNDANKTSEAATTKVVSDVDAKTKDAANKANENLKEIAAKPIELKLDIKKLAEDFDALQSNLKSIAETGVKGLTQNTLQIGQTKDKVKELNAQLAKETNAQNKAALQEQLAEQQKQLKQRSDFEAQERKKAQQASKDAFKNDVALANEKNRTDQASILKVAKDRRNAALSILAQELDANRLLETDERKRRQRELDDKFRLEREKLQAELRFGDQSAAARDNVNKQLIEKEKAFQNEKRKLQIEFLRQDVENALKTAELQQKADVSALQTRLQRIITQDVQGAEERARINEQLAQKNSEIEVKAYLDSIPQFVAALNKRKEEVVRKNGETSKEAIAEINKFNQEAQAAFAQTRIDADGLEVDIPQSQRLANIQKLLGLDEASAKLALQNFDALQKRIANESAAKARENERQIQEARINTQLDFAQREFDLRSVQLERELERDLAVAGTNAALIAQARLKFEIGTIEAQSRLRASGAKTIAEREAASRLGELEKAFAQEIGAFRQNEELKTQIQAQAEQIRASLQRGGLSPETQAAAQEQLRALDEQLATFRQNEALKLDIEREFGQRRLALLQEQMKQRAGIVRLGADGERAIYDTLFSGLSQIAERFNTNRADFEGQKISLKQQKEEELRVTNARGKERLEIIKKFREQEQELDRKFTGGAAALAQLKAVASDVLGGFAKTSQEAFQRATVNAKGFADVSGEAFAQLGFTAIATIGQVAASGGDVGKALGKAAFDALQALVPIIVAQITGLSLAQPDSVASFGATAAPRIALLTALLQGAISVARAALGFKKGGYTGDGNPNAEAGVVHKGEWVSTYDTTKRERKLLEFIHKGGSSQQFFEREYLPKILEEHRITQSVQTIIAKPQYAPERLAVGANTDIARVIAQQTHTLDARLANVEYEMRNTAKQFQHRSEMTANVVFDNDRYMKDMQIKQKRSALG